MYWILLLIGAMAIASELFYQKKYRLRIYTFKNTFSHFQTIVGQQLFNIPLYGSGVGIYLWAYQRAPFHLFTISNPLHWVIVFLLTDLSYFAAHWVGHHTNLLMTSHSVHHQATDFNHFSALRQSWLTKLLKVPFYLPLLILGIPPGLFAASLIFNQAVQYFSHNGVIRRDLGILEYIIVTPKSHRIHHGTNEPYINKNLGGAFIIWDRIFGSYQNLVPGIEVRVGGNAQPEYFQPLASQLHFLRFALKKASALKTTKEKLLFWLKQPEQWD